MALSRTPATFTVNTFYDAEADRRVAVCDPLGVATEAESPEAVRTRFLEIAPDVTRENGMRRSARGVTFTFVRRDLV